VKWRLDVRTRAKTDVRKAHEWYEKQQAGLGADFVVAVKDAIGSLKANPYICQLYYRKYRQLLPKRFPYRIFYLIDGEKIVVFRILHSAQDFTKHLK